MDTYTNNTQKIVIKSHDLRLMNELKKEYNEKKEKIIQEIIQEIQEEFKLLKKEQTK